MCGSFTWAWIRRSTRIVLMYNFESPNYHSKCSPFELVWRQVGDHTQKYLAHRCQVGCCSLSLHCSHATGTWSLREYRHRREYPSSISHNYGTLTQVRKVSVTKIIPNFDSILCKFDPKHQPVDHNQGETSVDLRTSKTDNYSHIGRLKIYQTLDPEFRSFSPNHFHGDLRAHLVSFLSGRFFLVRKFSANFRIFLNLYIWLTNSLWVQLEQTTS